MFDYFILLYSFLNHTVLQIILFELKDTYFSNICVLQYHLFLAHLLADSVVLGIFIHLFTYLLINLFIHVFVHIFSY